MNFYINEDKCKELGLTIPELLAILLVKQVQDIPKLFKDMVSKQMLHKEDSLNSNLSVTSAWDDKASSALLNADPIVPSIERIESLAISLMDIFPKGKQPGGLYYFRGNKKDVSLKLKKFFKLYGNTYTDSQILEAARKYVASFNGNYKYMKLLKYFIWKDERKLGEDGQMFIEETSILADYITNEGSDSTRDINWTANLV